MRNGIYRVWVKGPKALSSGAVLVRDGDLIAVNATFGFVGHYRVAAGRFTGEMLCQRLSDFVPPVGLPPLDQFHMTMDGLAGHDFAAVTGSFAEVPGFAQPIEFAWLCEA